MPAIPAAPTTGAYTYPPQPVPRLSAVVLYADEALLDPVMRLEVVNGSLPRFAADAPVLWYRAATDEAVELVGRPTDTATETEAPEDAATASPTDTDPDEAEETDSASRTA